MGMDVYGKNPENESGEYFRNNVWWWRPLAEYVCSIAPDITKHCEYWQTNDGDGLNEAHSIQLAEKIKDKEQQKGIGDAVYGKQINSNNYETSINKINKMIKEQDNE